MPLVVLLLVFISLLLGVMQMNIKLLHSISEFRISFNIIPHICVTLLVLEIEHFC